MNLAEITEKAKVVLAEEFEVEESAITPEASLKETLVLVEQHCGVTLKGPDFVGVKSFADFYRLLDSKLNA